MAAEANPFVDGIQWDLMLRIAHQEWLAISERYLRMQRTLRERGGAVGLGSARRCW